MSDSPRVPLRGLSAAVDETSLWLLFALMAGSGASVLALGLLLRSNQALTRRTVIGTILHSVAWGSAVFLMTYEQTSLGLPFVLGLSIFSGMGAASFIDLVLLLVRQRLGINVTFNPPSPTPTPPPAPPFKEP
jgi:hypothetical protein